MGGGGEWRKKDKREGKREIDRERGDNGGLWVWEDRTGHESDSNRGITFYFLQGKFRFWT